jgi:hypothetical protein
MLHRAALLEQSIFWTARERPSHPDALRELPVCDLPPGESVKSIAVDAGLRWRTISKFSPTWGASNEQGNEHQERCQEETRQESHGKAGREEGEEDKQGISGLIVVLLAQK